MSSSQFIKVKLMEWDCSKVTIGVLPKASSPSVLYDGKIPILVLAGDGVREKYVVSSFDGLKRNMKYDSNSKKFLDVWEGDWSVSFKVADTYVGATGL
jgi:hypothetical protein